MRFAQSAIVLLCSTSPSPQQQLLSSFKTRLQEYCQRSGLALPAYSLAGTDGPAHAQTFQVMAIVSDEYYTGGWQSTLKAAQGSAAEEALRCLVSPDVTGECSAKKQGTRLPNLYPDAIGDLLNACLANDWAVPTYSSAGRDGAAHVEVVTLHDDKGDRTFEGRSSRVRSARSEASEATLRVLREELAADPAATGAFARLRDLSVRRGLVLQQATNRVWVGGKPRVLRLYSPAALDAPDGVGIESDPSRVRVEDCPAWSGLEVSAIGRGLTRTACLDAASVLVEQQLRHAVSEKRGAAAGRVSGRSVLARAVSLGDGEEEGASYTPRQAVFATNCPAECDAWVREHAGIITAPSAIALDCEWVPELPESRGVALVQVATEDACLLAHGEAAASSAALHDLLRDPRVLKIGKDLREDWQRLQPTLLGQTTTVTTRNIGGAAAGWLELVAFLPFHDGKVSLNVLCETFLGVSYTMKGTVSHEAWGEWPLREEMQAYAAADVCAIIDVLYAAERARRAA